MASQENRDRNKACWCGSGKKLKRCHLRRELEKPVERYEVAQLWKRLQDRKFTCSYIGPDLQVCTREAIKSHTLQRAGPLKAIARDGHVWAIKPDILKGDFTLQRIGLSSASTFPGFCKQHDDSVFKPIERSDVTLTAETAFLFGYRAICLELHAKKAMFAHFENLNGLDRGQPVNGQRRFQNVLQGMKEGAILGQKDVAEAKHMFEGMLASGSTSGFHYYAAEFAGEPSIASTGAFGPEFDLQGNRVQVIPFNAKSVHLVTLTVWPLPGRCICVLGWPDTQRPGKALASTLQGLNQTQKADAFVRLAFETIENTYFRKSWWDGLGDSGQREVQRLALEESASAPLELGRGGKFAEWTLVKEMHSF